METDGESDGREKFCRAQIIARAVNDRLTQLAYALQQVGNQALADELGLMADDCAAADAFIGEALRKFQPTDAAGE